MICPCPRPLSPETLVMECDEFKEHVIEMIVTGVDTRLTDILRDWEDDILWGVER